MVSCLYTCVMQLFTAFSAGAVLAGNFIGDYILRKIHLWNVAVVVYIGWLLTIGIDGGFVLEFIRAVFLAVSVHVVVIVSRVAVVVVIYAGRSIPMTAASVSSSGVR